MFEIYKLSIASSLKEVALAIGVPVIIALASYGALTTLLDERAQILAINERNIAEDPRNIYR